MKIRLKTLCEALLEAGLLCEEPLYEMKHNKGKVVKFKYRNIEYEREVTHLKNGSEVFYLPNISGSVSIDDVELIDSEDKKDDDNDNSKNDKKEVDGVENSENNVAAISDLEKIDKREEKKAVVNGDAFARDVRDKAIKTYVDNERPEDEYNTEEYKEECKQVSKDLFEDSKYRDENIERIKSAITGTGLDEDDIINKITSGDIIENHYLFRSKESEEDGQVFASFRLNEPNNKVRNKKTNKRIIFLAIYNVSKGKIEICKEHDEAYKEFNDLYNVKN